MNICIIDDDSLFCKYLGKILTSQKTKVRYFSCIPDILLFEKFWFEICIVDIHIWEITSISFLQNLIKTYPNIKIIISSGNINEHEYDILRNIGIDSNNVCIKPFTWKFIKEKISAWEKKSSLYK